MTKDGKPLADADIAIAVSGPTLFVYIFRKAGIIPCKRRSTIRTKYLPMRFFRLLSAAMRLAELLPVTKFDIFS